MGTDKALLKPWGESGPTMLANTVDLLSHITPRVIVACSPGKIYPQYECLVDEVTGHGPCQGVAAGLRLAKTEKFSGVIAVACDMPALKVETLTRLAAIWNGKTLACLYKSEITGKVEMLTALYSVHFLPFLSAGMARGERSLFKLLPLEKCQYLVYSSSEDALFYNCNNPVELQAFEKRLR